MQLMKSLVVCLIFIVVVACSSSDEMSDNRQMNVQTACSTDEIKQWAYSSLLDYYLFYDQVPMVNPSSYESAAALVEDLRVLPYDRYSRVTTTSADEEVFVEGKSFGPGVIWLQDNQGQLRAAGVYRDSPMGRAGVNRGDIFVSINGVQAENLTNDMYYEFVGTRDEPRAASWTFQDAVTSQNFTVDVTSTLFNINTVLHSEVIAHTDYSENIGYLVLESFLGVSEAELDSAVDMFRANNIRELVLDLRYNGGGYVTVATKLASQIGGAATDGQPLMEYRHNDKYSEFDFSIDFESVAGSLDLDRLIVLTSEYTASASEIVISALSPYIDVVTIGGRTTGKPYTSFGNDYCGQRLHALQAEGFNANNVSVYGGVAPSCGATDDLTRDFGTNGGQNPEGMLEDALNYLAYGTCNTPTLASSGLQNDSPIENRSITALTQTRNEGGARVTRAR